MRGDTQGQDEAGPEPRTRRGREAPAGAVVPADAGAPGAAALRLGGAALRLEGVSLPFAPDIPEGLRGLSLEVGPGERLVLVGASGVGKSSLLRAVAGLHPLTAGRIEIGGRTVEGPGIAPVPPEARGAVNLHQVPLLFPHLSVLENVAFPLRVRGVGRGEREARARDLLAAVRLEVHATRSPEALSGGERHRVALARAVAAQPPLLLLDEPLSSLDPSLRHEVREAIVALQEASGAGLLLVTHDLDEAGALGHRVGILVPGRLAQIDPPSRLFGHPASLEVSRFLGYRNEIPLRWDLARRRWHHPVLEMSEMDVAAGAEGASEAAGAAGAGGVAGDLDASNREGMTEAPEPAPGGSAVAILPPGTVRVLPLGNAGLGTAGLGRADIGGAEIGKGTAGGLFGSVLGVRHPGPRPVVEVRIETTAQPREDTPGEVPPAELRLEADPEPGFLPAVGARVRVFIAWDRARLFPAPPMAE